ncbi:MAG: hypothetical protein HQK96_03880 [Nitrospirae bacterium]|nr:hypothetical protein [Nitrospirota bacterium]
METPKNVDVTITATKGITITWATGGFLIRNGNLKNFSWDSRKQLFYFNSTYGTDLRYDCLLPYANIATYGGVTVPSFAVLLAAIKAELISEG